jgi:hypothetical protein
MTVNLVEAEQPRTSPGRSPIPASLLIRVRPMTHYSKLGLLAFSLVFGAVGCSGSGGKGVDQTAAQGALAEVADMLRATTQTNGKGPAKLSDLNTMQSMYARGYQAVKSGEVVIIWGHGVKAEGESATGGEIVAYEKNAPTAGGYVLFTSGEVKEMTADEFKAAPKAK